MSTKIFGFIVAIILIAVIVVIVTLMMKKESFIDDPENKFFDVNTPSFAQSTNLKNLEIPCYLDYTGTKRYMYQAIPPTTNSSIDIRSEPAWIKPVNTNDFGIFQHTGIYGNNRDVRLCTKVTQKENLK